MTEEILKPTPEGQVASEQALQEIRERSFAGRNPELGRMLNCVFCGLRHREHRNGRDKPCEQNFSADIRIRHVLVTVPEQIAGQTKHTKPDFLIESEIPRKQTRLVFGAKPFKGKRKNPRNTGQRPLTKWQRILKAKAKGAV